VIDLPKTISSSTFERRFLSNTELLTTLVDIVFTLLKLSLKHPVENTRFLGDSTMALGQDGKLLTGYLEFLYRFTNDLLVDAAGIDIGCIPG